MSIEHDGRVLSEDASSRGERGAEPHGSRRRATSNGRVTARQYTGDLLVAQAEERRRIARELHDGTASTLVALSLDLTRLVESLPRGDPRDLAAACASLCHQSLRELRAVAFVLHPPLLEHEGLAVALQWLAEGFSKRSGIQVTFDPRGSTGERLPPHVELTLYRIVQEGLTNVLRHSGSRTAHVSLAKSAAEVRLTVSDEGRASSVRGRVQRGGVGVSSMRERVQTLGGSLKLSFRRSGTVLTAVVPRASRVTSGSDGAGAARREPSERSRRRGPPPNAGP